MRDELQAAFVKGLNIPMEYKEIRELAALMKEMGLTMLEFSDDATSVRMERAAASAPEAKAHVNNAREWLYENDEEPAEAGVVTIRSPMVGVLYTSPDSDKEPYVSVGDTVRAGDVLCIIEAMKIMNEITAEREGTIVEICAGNKQVVEYGQPLFMIDTSAVG